MNTKNEIGRMGDVGHVSDYLEHLLEPRKPPAEDVGRYENLLGYIGNCLETQGSYSCEGAEEVGASLRRLGDELRSILGSAGQ